MGKTKQLLYSADIYKQIICEVDGWRGALMGRNNTRSDADAKDRRIYRRRLPLVYDGAYDRGGAYWGGGTPLCVEYTLDKSYVRFFRK